MARGSFIGTFISTASQIKDAIITGAKLVNSTITATQLADNAVTEGKLDFCTYKLIHTETLASAVTSVQITGLDGDNDKEYMLVLHLKEANVAGNAIYLRPNNSSFNCSSVFFWADGSSLSHGSSAAEIRIGGLSQNAYSNIIVQFSADSGSGMQRMIHARCANAATVQECAGKWADTSTNITSLTVVSSGASSIAAGSVIELYRRSVT